MRTPRFPRRAGRAGATPDRRLADAAAARGLVPDRGAVSLPAWLPLTTLSTDRVAVGASARGWWQGLEVHALEVIVSRQGRPLTYACALSRVAANLPRLTIDPTDAAPATVADVGIAQVDPEGLRFEREFRMSSPDHIFARRFLGPSTIRWFLARTYPRLHFVAEGPNVACCSSGANGTEPVPAGLADLLSPLLDSLGGFAERLTIARASTDPPAPSYSEP